jgi:hypothetical protein
MSKESYLLNELAEGNYNEIITCQFLEKNEAQMIQNKILINSNEQGTKEFQQYDIGRLFRVLTTSEQDINEVADSIEKCEAYKSGYENGETLLDYSWYDTIFDCDLEDHLLSILTKNFIRYVEKCMRENKEIPENIIEYLLYCLHYNTWVSCNPIADQQDIIFIWNNYKKIILDSSDPYLLYGFASNKNSPEPIIIALYDLVKIKAYIAENPNTPEYILNKLEEIGIYDEELFGNTKVTLKQALRVSRLT